MADAAQPRLKSLFPRASSAMMRHRMKRNSSNSSSLRFITVTGVAIAAAAALLIAHSFPRRVSADHVSGEAIYREYCASCHDHPGPRVPPRSALQALSTARILRPLDAGVMMRIAYGLQRSQREAVAQYLGKAKDDTAPPAAAFCSDRSMPPSQPSHSNW